MQKIRIKFFLQPFRLGEVSVLQIFSTRNARYEQQVGCRTEERGGRGRMMGGRVAGWQGGRGRVMGGVERWRGVWMGWSHQNQKNPNFGQVQKLFGNYNPRAASSHLLCFVTFTHSNTFISLQFQP